MKTRDDTSPRKVPTYCYQCVAGPDLLKVKVENDIATEVEPNFDAAEVHPGAGKICVKAYGLIQKTYNPHRVLTPMRRTNPKKGRHKDPGFVPVSWDTALGEIADKLNGIRSSGLLDDSGYPRVAASFGGGGTPQAYMGTFPAFLAAWGPVDFGLGSGQGVKCYHSEHLYGEFWHRAFTVGSDTPAHPVPGFLRQQCRGLRRGLRRLAPCRRTGPGHEAGPDRAGPVDHRCLLRRMGADPTEDRCRLPVRHAACACCTSIPAKPWIWSFLKTRTASRLSDRPQWLLSAAIRKPSFPWCGTGNRGTAVRFDAPDSTPELEGCFEARGVEIGPDGQTWLHSACEVKTAFTPVS